MDADKIIITAKDRKLAGYVFNPKLPPNLNSAVLFLHGWGSAQDRYFKLAEKLSEKSFVCLTFDMSGHGQSEGKLGELLLTDYLDDAMAAYDALAGVSGVNVNRVTVVGSSFGCYIACLLSAKRKIDKLALRVPADYPNERFNQPKFTSHDDAEIWDWRSEPRNYKEGYALSALHDFPGEVLIVESGKDESVPHQTVQNFVDAIADKSRLTYIVMEGAPHSLKGISRYAEQYENLLINWLGKN